MRSIRILTVIIIISCLTPAALHTVSKDGPVNQMETVIKSGKYKIIHEDGGQRIIMEGFGCRMEPGKPMLPEREVLIALPPCARVQQVEVHGIGGTLLSKTYRIVPAPPIVPLAETPLSRELTSRMQREWRENKETTYSTDGVYPKEIGKITNSGSLRKYAYVSVSVCPFSYRPMSGKLMYYDAIRITVHFSVPPRGASRVLEFEELMHDCVADGKASELFINFEQVRDLYQTGQEPSKAPAEKYDYLIITTDSLAGAVSSSNFIPWKTALGYSMKTVLITDPEITSQAGIDLAEQIRNFLRGYYGLWGIRYVLFVGDYATVPMRYCYPNPDDHSHNPGDSENPGGSVPTDYYYADLSLSDAESWDTDGDGYHGEYNQDSPDFLAEVYVGRIPTSDTTRIVYTLDKLVNFEEDDGEWKEQALQPGTILFYQNQDHGGYPKIDGATLLNQIEVDFMSGWTVSRYSEQEGLDPSDFPWPGVSASAFMDDWQTGQYGIVNWSGHGAPQGVSRTVWDWDDGDGVPETDGSDGMSRPMLIDIWCTLDDDFPSIVFAVSCNVGYPEPNGLGNLGIDLLTESGFGASAGIVSSSRAAYISADVIAYPGGAESICYEFNRYGIGENENLGEALYDAKHYCYVNYGWAHYAEYINQFNFDLYGDPSMMRRIVPTEVENRDLAHTQQSVLLLQNYPNPFNPKTIIRYVLPRATQIRLNVYNVKGEFVAALVDGHVGAGRNEVSWDAKDFRGKAVASGVYFYRLVIGDFMQTKKMVLIK